MRGMPGGILCLGLRHTRRWFLIIGMLLLWTWLTACGQPGSTGRGTPTPTSVPSPAGTSTSLPTATAGPVTLHVGATTYRITDTITVTLSNQSTQTIYFPDHLTNCTVILLQRLVGADWLTVNECQLMIHTSLHKLEAGKSLTVALVASSARPWPIGLYHATLRYGTTDSFDGLTATISSAGFQVVP